MTMIIVTFDNRHAGSIIEDRMSILLIKFKVFSVLIHVILLVNINEAVDLNEYVFNE